MKPETKPWWRQAGADLETARINLQADRFYAASWFCQQAAEKALKALYVEQRTTMPPRIHDLLHLGVDLGALNDISAQLAVLNPVFGIVRYPPSVELRRLTR